MGAMLSVALRKEVVGRAEAGRTSSIIPQP